MNRICGICFRPIEGPHLEFKKAWFYGNKYIARMDICIYCEKTIRDESIKARRKDERKMKKFDD